MKANTLDTKPLLVAYRTRAWDCRNDLFIKQNKYLVNSIPSWTRTIFISVNESRRACEQSHRNFILYARVHFFTSLSLNVCHVCFKRYLKFLFPSQWHIPISFRGTFFSREVYTLQYEYQHICKYVLREPCEATAEYVDIILSFSPPTMSFRDAANFSRDRFSKHAFFHLLKLAE